MRTVKNTLVKRIATLAIAVAGLGMASSQTFAQDAQDNCTPIESAYQQPVIYVRPARSHRYVSANALRATMESVGTRTQADLDASPQWVCVNAELQKAMADVTAAEDRIQQSASLRPDYQEAAARKQAAQDQAAELRESGASIEQITAAAQSALDAGKTLTQIEQQTAAGDPELIDARARLQALAVARKAMQDGVRAQVLNDPQWQHAERRLNRFQ